MIYFYLILLDMSLSLLLYLFSIQGYQQILIYFFWKNSCLLCLGILQYSNFQNEQDQILPSHKQSLKEAYESEAGLIKV